MSSLNWSNFDFADARNAMRQPWVSHYQPTMANSSSICGDLCGSVNSPDYTLNTNMKGLYSNYCKKNNCAMQLE